ncbi:GIY-YIG nuclease family protein [Kineosporia babensis]|uniref:GIY-YIG nuclease family protein n=1 Tax=Kineosporia babensis TaxID=499548 RepID=A0A9X1NCL9_9ACTN|nr:GIY-YIG nuclease family protein [Kineosporia babensis]MCD5311384.1 GIY-YIG nuclease family protein [Kineosporia babensis]
MSGRPLKPRPAAVAILPAEPGVYRFRDATGKALYIGRAGNLRRRVGSYWGALADRPRLRRMVPQVAAIEALVCESEHEAAWLERNLLQRSKPRWNRARGGQELPVYLRLDDSAAAPRLDLVFGVEARPGVRYFGPYLGSGKVRAALAGLRRCYPLAYTGSRLTAAERDMAATRGVNSADRATLVAAVVAALERADDDAALKLLSERRDRASADLLFEIAAAVQDEIEGLTWVVAPQRMTVDGRPDQVLAGESDGFGLRLLVRDGRVCEWKQGSGLRLGPKSTAAGDWDVFLKRNAALAAELATLPVIRAAGDQSF